MKAKTLIGKIAVIGIMCGVAAACTPTPIGPTVITLAGSPGAAGSADGASAAARFGQILGVAVDSSGNVYVADSASDGSAASANHTIRKITPAGEVTTFAGTAGVSGSADGTGAAARFRNPQGIVIDRQDNLYVADTGNQTIRKITPAGVVSTIAGSPGIAAHVDGAAGTARFYWPYGVAVDDSLNVYVVGGDDTIRKITPAGVVSTLAGSSKLEGTADGTGAAARFAEPWGITSTAGGTLFVADQKNHTIRRVTADGVVITLAGVPGLAGSADGTGSGATFRNPSGIALDDDGSVYVTDLNNHTIRRVTQGGDVTTIAGLAGSPGSADGAGSVARFRFPTGIATRSGGPIFVADSGNYTVRRIS